MDNCAADPATAALGGQAPYWQSYRYDTVGNRTSEVQHAASGDITRTYTYPAAGTPQPHTVRSVSTTRPGQPATTDTFGYNPTGDTVSRVLAGQPGHTLTWDAEDRLATDTAGGQTTSFVYTPDGSRLVRRDPTHTTLYLPDGTELRWQRSGTTVAGSRYYTHAGATIAVRQGSTVTWLAADHHGTHQYAVAAAGLAVTRRRSLPFGQPRGTPPTAWPGERGFVGGTTDPTTGLTHLGAREYDPALGRFVSVDPIMDLADPQQMHGYAYANNNPLTWSDPSGLKIADCEATHTSCKTGGSLQKPGPNAHHGDGEQQANHNKAKNDAKGKSKPAYPDWVPDELLEGPPEWRQRNLAHLLDSLRMAPDRADDARELQLAYCADYAAVDPYCGGPTAAAVGELAMFIFPWSRLLKAAGEGLAALRNAIRGAKATKGGDDLMSALAASGVKHTPGNVVGIARDSSGRIIFLETGNSSAGLAHILERHASDFARAGIPESDIANLVVSAVSRGNVVGKQGTRPIYEVMFRDQPTRVAVTVGDNGFIVEANPVG